MKKKLIMVIALSFAVACSGCSKKEPAISGSQTQVVAKDIEIKTDSSKDEPKEEVKQEDDKVDVVVYYVDENGTVQNENRSVTTLDETSLWEALKEDGTVSDEAQVLSMTIDEKKRIHLDVNQAFGNQLRSTGTSGETMLIQCVVNSYLDSFACDEIMITEEGDTLVSGHAVYDAYLGKQS